MMTQEFLDNDNDDNDDEDEDAVRGPPFVGHWSSSFKLPPVAPFYSRDGVRRGKIPMQVISEDFYSKPVFEGEVARQNAETGFDPLKFRSPTQAKIHRFLFGDFREVCDDYMLIQEMRIQYPAPYPTWCPLSRDEVWGDRRFSRYTALVIRIHGIVRALKRYSGVVYQEKQELIYALWCHLDSHISMCLVIEKNSMFMNAQLDTVVDSEHTESKNGFAEDMRAGMTVFDVCCPSERLVFHEGELPDVIKDIPMCNFWDKKKQQQKVPAIIKLLSKAIPQPCLNRNLVEIFQNTLEAETPDCEFMDQFISMLLCTTLGMYRHCVNRPSFEVRKLLYDFFYFQPKNTVREEVLDWMDVTQSVMNTATATFMSPDGTVTGTVNAQQASATSNRSGRKRSSAAIDIGLLSAMNAPYLKRDGAWSIEVAAQQSKIDQKKIYVHESVVMYVLKEFLVFGTRALPALYQEVDYMFQWSEFESALMDATDALRVVVQDRYNERVLGIPSATSPPEHQFPHHAPHRRDITTAALAGVAVVDVPMAKAVKKTAPLSAEEFFHFHCYENWELRTDMKKKLHNTMYRPVKIKFIQSVVNATAFIDDEEIIQSQYDLFERYRLEQLARKDVDISNVDEKEAFNQIKATLIDEDGEIILPPWTREMREWEIKLLKKWISRYSPHEEIRLTLEVPETSDDVKRLLDTSKFPMRAFGVSTESIAEFMRIANLYHAKHSDKTVREGLMAIKERSVRDYEFIREFYLQINKYHSVLTFTLPYDMTVNQVRALRSKFDVINGEEMPPEAGEAFVCPNCLCFHNSVVRPGVIQDLYACGSIKVIVDADADDDDGNHDSATDIVAYCGDKRDKAEQKKNRSGATQFQKSLQRHMDAGVQDVHSDRFKDFNFILDATNNTSARRLLGLEIEDDDEDDDDDEQDDDDDDDDDSEEEKTKKKPRQRRRPRRRQSSQTETEMSVALVPYNPSSASKGKELDEEHMRNMVSYDKIVEQEMLKRLRKKMAKDMRKERQARECLDTSLLTINLCGKLLQLQEKLYTVCPQCGNFFCVEKSKYSGDKLTCMTCINMTVVYASHDVRCQYCNTSRQKPQQRAEGMTAQQQQQQQQRDADDKWAQYEVTMDHEMPYETKKVWLCKKCNKPFVKVLCEEHAQGGLAPPRWHKVVWKGIQNNWTVFTDRRTHEKTISRLSEQERYAQRNSKSEVAKRKRQRSLKEQRKKQ